MQPTKTDNKYKNGKIYAIRSFQTDNIYIGSTIQPLRKRLHDHRFCYERKCTTISSFEILKFDDNYIELLEEYPCENKMQLFRREGELIRLHKNSTVNKIIAGRTKLEYEHDNFELVKERRKSYNIRNRETIGEKKKLYYEENKAEILENHKSIVAHCLCGSTYRACSKSVHEKSTKHLDYVKGINRMQPKDIIECGCGSSFQKMEKFRHEKTKKHQEYLLTLLI